MTIARALFAPLLLVALAVLAVHMFMAPFDPSYGVLDALREGWSR